MNTTPTEPGEPILSIVGDEVALGPLHRDIIPLYLKWMNDFEVVRAFTDGLKPAAVESMESWYADAVKDEHQVNFIIYERVSMRAIGHTELDSVDYFHRTAEFGIVIGEKDCWGKGYGAEVAGLMLEYGFVGLGLHNIYLGVFSFNDRAIRAYTRAGFRVIGRRRECFRLGGQAYDEIYMDCLATEFQGTVLRRLLPDG